MGNSKSGRKGLTKDQFNRISRDSRSIILAEGYKKFESDAMVANYHEVSVSTVRAVRRAGTWDAFKAARQARSSSDKPTTETKTLTLDEYNDLMDLRKRISDLEEWREDMYQREVEKLASDGLNDRQRVEEDLQAGETVTSEWTQRQPRDTVRRRSFLPWRNR